MSTLENARVFLGRPNPKQELFLKDEHRFVIFGGARGGGKSWSVRNKAKALALNKANAGIKILIVRRTYPELMKNHIQILRSELYGIAKYNDKDKMLTFHNGSTITFMYCSRDSDLDALQGAEYDVIFVDEATMLTEFQIKALAATNRGPNAFPKRMYLTCNPGGQGHGYIKRIIDGEFIGDEDPDDYVFIPSKVTDNLILMEKDPDYIRKLQALPTKLREAWLEGNWNVYMGQFFEEFRDDKEHYQDRRWTHVIEPFDVPKEWTIYRSFDWGSNKPSSTGWYAIDYDGTIYAILELYTWTGEPDVGNKWTDYQIFSEIRKIEDTHPWLKGKRITGVADPSIWGKGNGTGISTEEVASQHGVYFQKGDNDRIPGWMQVHYRMQFDEEGYPRLYIFRNCKNLIRTIPLQMYDEVHVEDLDTKLEDHACDQLRYMCQARPIKPIVKVEEEPVLFDPLNQSKKIDRYRRV